jgi:GMP synthase-like glutamine amidotransferase
VRALFIQHDPASQPGLVGERLRHHGFELDLLRIGRSIDDGTFGGSFPRAGDFDLVVPLGAIWSVYDTSAVGSWIDRELDLLREADARRVPVLGICFGGQALAAAHGATVGPATRTEIGFGTIETDDPALVPPGPWMQWHSDAFEVPADATELARNEVCSQAFRLRRNLGLQFHPEVDETIVSGWLELGGEAALADLEAASGAGADELLAALRAEKARCETDVASLVDTFLVEVALLG